MAGDDVDHAKSLRESLRLDDDELDEDLGIALTSLITTAVHDKEPKRTLSDIVKALKQGGSVSSLEPLTIIPVVIGSQEAGADDLLELMSKECSAKEVVMAVEEVMESLDRQLQLRDEESEESVNQLSIARQLARVVRAYEIAIPRLPKWKKSPRETVESRLAELESVLSLVGTHATAGDDRVVISAVTHLVDSLKDGADEKTKELLHHLLDETVSAFANCIREGVAKKAFAANFSRLVLPQAASSSSSQGLLTGTWSALRALGVDTRYYESRPSLVSLVLLAHEPTYTFSTQTLSAFFPIVLSSIQSNVALDEVLSILLSSLAPLRSQTPRPELSVDLIVPLVHLLPHLASNHSDPEIRHYTYRVLSLVLGLAPSPVRFHLLHDILGDKDVPPQMHVAAVGLLKEAVLEGLAAKDKNMFASPLLLSTFGPIVLRPDPPDLDSVSLDDFLKSAEPLRMVECLAFYYMLLLRDTKNQTGVRDDGSRNVVQRELLQPLRQRLEAWQTALAASPKGNEHNHDSTMQLGILDMWLERVQGTLDKLKSAKP
ncbi:hypothetical protein K466DRAFT_574710 [Polyporus arcularius HHB13444]|uniref:TIP120-domain-containing protein n=1 Tax=Polyporus arcularius HHB13444 TaxID=1314778 RepID=A0A5C3PL82_9APHY|nr:hypothetical protein K466DRAFT_574710 [Polyporus arcularius HHB13444]